jgi:hypothetical protein
MAFQTVQRETNSTPSSSYPYSDAAVGMIYHPHPHQAAEDHLQGEWNKLRVAQQRLALQQERMQLDQELLENEKRNFRRSSKLKRTTAAAATLATATTASPLWKETSDEIKKSVTFDSQTDPSGATESSVVQELKERLAEAEAKLKQRDANVDDELRKNLEMQLADTHRSLASMLVERDLLRQERDSLLLVNEVEQPARNASLNRCEKCAQQQIKMERLQDELGSLKLKCSMHEVKQEELIAQHLAEIKKLKDASTVLQQDKEALESELQSSREVEIETLQQRIEEQAKQLDDFKLMISRGKLLLEDATTKSVRLQTKCSDLEAKVDEQGGSS